MSGAIFHGQNECFNFNFEAARWAKEVPCSSHHNRSATTAVLCSHVVCLLGLCFLVFTNFPVHYILKRSLFHRWPHKPRDVCLPFFLMNDIKGTQLPKARLAISRRRYATVPNTSGFWTDLALARCACRSSSVIPSPKAILKTVLTYKSDRSPGSLSLCDEMAP